MSFSVGVIGLGSIGANYDLDDTSQSRVLSHMKAFTTHDKFDILGAVDVEQLARDRCESHYDVPVFATVGEFYEHHKPDVIVVATPTETHLSVIRECLSYGPPKVFLCEKPLAGNSKDGEIICQLCSDLGIHIYVNYIRRSDPGVIEVKKRLDDGVIRGPVKALVWYSKGLLHSGCHFLDLLNFWFGDTKHSELIPRQRLSKDRDENPDFFVTFEKASAVFYSVPDGHTDYFAVEVLFSNGRLRLDQFGKLIWEDSFRGCDKGHQRYEVLSSNMDRYQFNVVDGLVNVLENQDGELCVGAAALDQVKVIEQIVKAANRER